MTSAHPDQATDWGRRARGAFCVALSPSARPITMAVAYTSAPAHSVLTSRAPPTPGTQMSEIQRSRLLAAAIEIVAEVGYPRASVAQLVARAGVSRKTFYEIFSDREDCFLAAFDHVVSEARMMARGAYERASGWQDGVRSALATLLALLD